MTTKKQSSFNGHTCKEKRIQKFKGDLSEVDGGGTILFTKIIQLIQDSNTLGVYCYLASKPDEWEINPKEIINHFSNLGRDKVYQILSDLCRLRLVVRKEIRSKGKFVEFVYYLYLAPE